MEYEILAYDRDAAGDWQRIGAMARVGADRQLPNRSAFLDTLRQHGATPIPARYGDLDVGAIRLKLRQ
jgi:hypothetical protein